MLIETKFSNGDKVYKISNATEPYKKECPRCKDYEKIRVNGRSAIKQNGEDYTFCSLCGGYNVVHDYITAWRIVGLYTIGMVRAEVTNSMGVNNGVIDPELAVSFSNYKEQKGYKEEYMCVETGIGSGSIHYADTLFALEDDAKAECELRNKGESHVYK